MLQFVRVLVCKYPPFCVVLLHDPTQRKPTPMSALTPYSTHAASLMQPPHTHLLHQNQTHHWALREAATSHHAHNGVTLNMMHRPEVPTYQHQPTFEHTPMSATQPFTTHPEEAQLKDSSTLIEIPINSSDKQDVLFLETRPTFTACRLPSSHPFQLRMR